MFTETFNKGLMTRLNYTEYFNLQENNNIETDEKCNPFFKSTNKQNYIRKVKLVLKERTERIKKRKTNSN